MTTALASGKKPLPDSSGEEGIGSWLQLVRELKRAEGYDAPALARAGHWQNLGFWLARPVLATALFMGLGSLVVEPFQAMIGSLMAVPLLLATTLGAARDQLAMRERPSLLSHLRRWSPACLRALPLYLAFLASTLAPIHILFVLRGFYGETLFTVFFFGILGLAAWTWGCVLSELVLAGRSWFDALITGVRRAICSVVRLPAVALGALRRLGRRPAVGEERLLWTFLLGGLLALAGSYLLTYAVLLVLSIVPGLRLHWDAVYQLLPSLLLLGHLFFLEVAGSLWAHDYLAILAEDPAYLEEHAGEFEDGAGEAEAASLPPA